MTSLAGFGPRKTISMTGWNIQDALTWSLASLAHENNNELVLDNQNSDEARWTLQRETTNWKLHACAYLDNLTASAQACGSYHRGWCVKQFAPRIGTRQTTQNSINLPPLFFSTGRQPSINPPVRIGNATKLLEFHQRAEAARLNGRMRDSEMAPSTVRLTPSFSWRP